MDAPDCSPELVEFDGFDSLPYLGEAGLGKLYINKENNEIYRYTRSDLLGPDTYGYIKLSDYVDTKNTAGSTHSSSKLYLIGATSQAANPQTYSHDTAYVGTDGCLYSGGSKVLTAHQDISGKVSGPSSATANRVATFSDTTGKVIKDSGYTIATSVPSGAVFTDTVPTYTYDSTNQKLTISY